jgi:hypothetical protein
MVDMDHSMHDQLIKQEQHPSFGKKLVGEIWELAL